MSAEFTDADVQLVAAALAASNVRRWEQRMPVPAWCDLATAVLTALAGAGRLVPDSAAREAALQDFATLRAKFESLPYWDDGAFAILDRLDAWLGAAP